ncbi:hypothetical protein FF1_041247 [Malus domestica]
MAAASNSSAELHQMDVKMTFLNGDLQEDIYMVQPSGFIERGEEEYGLQIKEIIYPKGNQIDIRAIVVGDHTMSILEI